MLPGVLQDSFGRRFSYLRLSITDACSFRCAYCLPNGYQRTENDFLTLAEIRNLVAGFAELGTWKIRLTGGEPTLRRDLLEIIRAVAETPGIRRVALSTNGSRLGALVPALKSAGVRALNVSIDSLNRERFAEITGVDRLPEILEGLEAALEAGFDAVKLNAVLLKDWNDGELDGFLAYIRNRPVSVRFIELMPTGTTRELFERRHVRAEALRGKLLEQGWRPRARGEADGPADELEHPEYAGRVGLIAPYAKDFCATCNRLRITSRGELRLCLFGEGNSSIRRYLQHESQRGELQAAVAALLAKKEVSHYLPEGRFGNNQTFSAMGG